MRRTTSGRRIPVGRRAWIAFIAGGLAACTLAGSASAQIQAGDILVADFSAGGGLGRLFQVPPQPGVREVLTEFSAFPSTGGDDPRWIAIERDGRILIVDPSAGTNNRGALFRIRFDPETGTFIPEVLSDFGTAGRVYSGARPKASRWRRTGRSL